MNLKDSNFPSRFFFLKFQHNMHISNVNAHNFRQIILKIELTLTELPTRFVTICLNLPGSPITTSGTLSETNTASYIPKPYHQVGRFVH